MLFLLPGHAESSMQAKLSDMHMIMSALSKNPSIHSSGSHLINLCANSWSGFCQHYQRWIYWRPKDFIFLLMNLQLFAMSFHMSLNSLEGPVSLSEREMDSFTPSPLDGRQLRSVMQEFFSFHLIMRHDEKYVYIFVSVIIIIIITNWGMSFSMIWNAQSSAPCYSSDHAKAESNNCFIIPSK